MVKKGAKASKHSITHSSSPFVMEKALLENFISLQRVMTNLAVKFDSLSDNISKLLQVFEISAKSFAEKAPGEGDKEFLDKLNVLLDQNKVIAKGITMMEEKVRERAQQSQTPQFQPQAQQFQSQTPQFQSQIPDNFQQGMRRPLPKI